MGWATNFGSYRPGVTWRGGKLPFIRSLSIQLGKRKPEPRREATLPKAAASKEASTMPSRQARVAEHSRDSTLRAFEGLVSWDWDLNWLRSRE